MVGSNQLTPETLVWKPGMTNWQEAGSIAELQGIFNTTIPNIPPINK